MAFPLILAYLETERKRERGRARERWRMRKRKNSQSKLFALQCGLIEEIEKSGRE